MIYEDTILDCYTDEPAGLGVPPYLGVHPRYLAGHLKGKVNYITIDDLRNYFEPKKEGVKTDIKRYNLTRKSVQDVLEKTKTLYCVVGIQTPGKYLSALPGTIKELTSFLDNINSNKILYGPVVSTGTQLQGGKIAEKIPGDLFDGRMGEVFGDYSELASLAVKGAGITKQIPWPKMIEIETGRGCIMGKCSFCTEPLKSKVEWREQKDIHNEIKALYDSGERNFRLGKQSCFFSYKGINTNEIEKLLKPIGRDSRLKLDCLHIDNIIPSLVDEDRTKLLVKHCTEGNIAAFGIESFDTEVIKQNTLNTSPEVAMKAVRIINKFGAKRGPNGMHYLLPGLNLVLGLKGESKKTGEVNYEYLKKMMDEKLLLRRINIRQVTPLPGTAMWDTGTKFIKKNKSKYWKWRNKIRKEIDYPMLQELMPIGTVLKKVRMEVHDGNHTFGRQMGSYPLIVGVKDRLEIKRDYNLEITGHMLRSVVGKVV